MDRRRMLCTASGLGIVGFSLPMEAAAQPAARQSDTPAVGPGKLDITPSGSRGRIVVTDSFSYCDSRVGADDVVVGCSYAGASTVSNILPCGMKAIIGHDAGIGKDRAGISGLALCDRLGIPMAAVEGRTAELSNGNSLHAGVISSANDAAARLGVAIGQPARQAADLLLAAHPGRPVTQEVDVDLELHELGGGSLGRILARVWLLDLPGTYPNDVFALGTHSARVAAEHAFRWNVKGWIANDAGMAKNDTGIEALGICGARGMPAASVSAFSACIGDAMSTYRDGVISAVNEPGRRLGITVGTAARDALRFMSA